MGKIDYAFKVGDTVRGNGHRYPSMIIERCNINGINYYHLDGVNKKELFKEDEIYVLIQEIFLLFEMEIILFYLISLLVMNG